MKPPPSTDPPSAGGATAEPPPAGESGASAAARAWLAHLWRAQPLAQSAEEFQRLLMVPSPIPPDVRARCMEGLGTIAFGLGRYGAALALYEEAVAFLADVPAAQSVRADVCWRLADLWRSALGAPEVAADYVALARDCGPAATPGLAVSASGWKDHRELVARTLEALCAGRGVDALRWARSTLESARTLADPFLSVDAQVLVAWAHLQQGDPSRALAVAAEAAVRARAGAYASLLIELHLVRAWAHLAGAETARARAFLAAAMDALSERTAELPWEAVQRSHLSRHGPLLHEATGALAVRDAGAAFQLAEWESEVFFPAHRASPGGPAVPSAPAPLSERRRAMAARPAPPPGAAPPGERLPDDADGEGLAFLRLLPHPGGLTVLWATSAGVQQATWGRDDAMRTRAAALRWVSSLAAPRPTANASAGVPAAAGVCRADQGVLHERLIAPFLTADTGGPKSTTNPITKRVEMGGIFKETSGSERKRTTRTLSIDDAKLTQQMSPDPHATAGLGVELGGWPVRHLVVLQSPDPALDAIPFHALEDGEGVVLGDRVQVTYAPSLATFRAARVRGARPQDAGGGMRGVVAVLPVIDRPEAAALRQQVLAAVCTAVPVACGTPTALGAALGEPGDLVFFGHGERCQELPALSGLVTEGGTLHAHDIAALAVRAQTVVLAACWGGYPGLRARDVGTGVVPSLLRAGAATVVAAGWPVRETVAAAFVLTFGDLRRTLGDAGAYREAALRLRERFPDPHDWAAFFLCGAALSPTPPHSAPP